MQTFKVVQLVKYQIAFAQLDCDPDEARREL